MAKRGDLQSADDRPPVSVGPGGLAVRCAASDPGLHAGQLARVATLELEAGGCLTLRKFGLRWCSVVRDKSGIITPSHRRGNHGVHRTGRSFLSQQPLLPPPSLFLRVSNLLRQQARQGSSAVRVDLRRTMRQKLFQAGESFGEE